MLLVNFIDSVSSGYPNTEKKADVQWSILVNETLAFSSFYIKTTTKQTIKETKAEVLVIKMEW